MSKLAKVANQHEVTWAQLNRRLISLPFSYDTLFTPSVGEFVKKKAASIGSCPGYLVPCLLATTAYLTAGKSTIRCGPKEMLCNLFMVFSAYRVPRNQLHNIHRHLELIFSAYRVPCSQLHNIHRHLELIFSAYHVPRSQLHNIHRHLELIFSAYRVPRSQPFYLTNSMWRGILQLLNKTDLPCFPFIFFVFSRRLRPF